MGVAGIFLRISNLIIRAMQLCTSVIIVGIFGFFIGVLNDHNAPIARWIKAVEGLAGAAAIYALLGVLLTLFLGGKMFFAMLAVGLDVCFVAAFIAIAIMTRGGRRRCSGFVRTPIGVVVSLRRRGREGRRPRCRVGGRVRGGGRRCFLSIWSGRRRGRRRRMMIRILRICWKIEGWEYYHAICMSLSGVPICLDTRAKMMLLRW